MKRLFILTIILTSCGNSVNDLEEDINSKKRVYDSLNIFQKTIEDSLQKNKSHIDSEVFVDSVMDVLDKAIKP